MPRVRWPTGGITNHARYFFKFLNENDSHYQIRHRKRVFCWRDSQWNSVPVAICDQWISFTPVGMLNPFQWFSFFYKNFETESFNFKPWSRLRPKFYFQNPLTLNLALDLIKVLKQKRNRLRSTLVPFLCFLQ